MNLDEMISAIQHFTRRWPSVKRFPGETERAQGDSDGGFERLLRATLDSCCVPGEVALARELHFYDGRDGAIVPQHEHDIVMRLTDGPCVVESKAWTEAVDKGPVIEFLGKILDFVAAPMFETKADSLKIGFVSLAGFTDAARRVMFAFGIIPFSKIGADLSFRFLDLQLAELQRRSDNADNQNEIASGRSIIGPYVNFERRKLTDIVRVGNDDVVVDLAGLRRGADIYDESRQAHSFALDIYRRAVRRLPA